MPTLNFPGFPPVECDGPAITEQRPRIADTLVNGRGRLTPYEAVEFLIECSGHLWSNERALANLNALSNHGPTWALSISDGMTYYSVSYDPTGWYWVKPA